MTRIPLLLTSALLLCLFSGGLAYSQEEELGKSVDPQADRLVREMADHLKAVKHFRFVVHDTIDEVQDNGQKLQFAHQRFGTVSRPNKLKVRSVGDLRNRTLWKDGKTITILDEDHNVYVQLEDPGTIDDMMDLLLEKYGLTTPLADLLSSDLYDVLMGGVETGEYAGLHRLGDSQCHHLAFRQPEIDWQIWIDAGEQPSLRKLVITYKQLPGEPQYTATTQSHTTLAEEPPGEFQFELPADANEIEIQPFERGKAEEDAPAQ